jgi:Kef-type K+ transport system membrane component KefB
MDQDALRTLVLISVIAALSPIIADGVRRWIPLPGVVIEIVLGIMIGPHVLGWAHLDEVLIVLAEFGLVVLIFLAGFEIDPDEVKGRPVSLAVRSWLVSLGLGIAVAWLLHALDVTSGIRFVAVALTTTAIGTLLPILGDAGLLPTPLGRNILAGGAMGELGPIIAISVALATDSLGRTVVVLLVFAAIIVLAGWLATRPARPRVVRLVAHTLHTSGQLGVRVCVLLCVLLVWAAARFDLDILLGAFAAGVVARLFLVEHSEPAHSAAAAGGAAEADPVAHALIAHGDHRSAVQQRLESLGFGFFIPLFFVVSGVHFDLEALGDAGALAKVPLFLLLFLLVRGAPALLYRRDLGRGDVLALGLLQSAALPLVVVITGVGVAKGQMRPDNAAAMVGAGLVSVVVFPIVAMALRRRGNSADTAATGSVRSTQ